ncbi:PQQ-binding-like beta-propeller repeat protein [Fulvivirgaceae bacterium BMA10]|uniref:PQQ-binding-like beta-propeller repeat protein n=1 Tax=Splendidivirga corallicola TaxID=3051826 RepID=A0ABT8KY44_9BACT|nr:PQQ-binding-like beta-propeller repeat protein [Fulvivirgaceae bacterium BMA10]
MYILSCNQKIKNSEKNTVTAIEGVFTDRQVEAGGELYMNACSSCHGKNLRGSESGSPLIGGRFLSKWKDGSAGALFSYTKRTMPLNNPESYDDETYSELLAFILNANGYPAGKNPLSSKKDELDRITLGKTQAQRVNFQFKPKEADHSTPTIEAEWLHHRGDYASTNYADLDQINSTNADQLKIAWRWKTDNFGSEPEYYYKATPLMVNGVLFTTAGSSRTVVAIDAITGETLWVFRFDEKERSAHVPRQNSGRGVAYWKAPENERDKIIYITPGFQLIALDAQTGRLVREFGTDGVVDLKKGLGDHVDPITTTIGSTSPPVIVNDVIVMGSCFPVGMAPASKKQISGDIMGYDIRTGKQLWIFHTIPRPGEFGNETWENNSWTYTGNVGAWTPLTADPELGYVYLPMEAPTGDYYGGHRHGDNLFSQSLVCLNAKTGKRVWHYQTVHHDIWDYDLPAPPVLANITVDDKPIKAVVQVTKQAFTFVFDRVTGEPVWPIEERPVPQSNVPGEKTSATQPFPTKPAPFDQQDYSDDILIDFTPEIKAEALKIAAKYHKGPLFTPINVYNPPEEMGTLMIPDAVGGANWQGAVLDPETNTLFVSSSTVLRPMSLESAPELSDMNYVAYSGDSRIGPYGLPLAKPPWGRITAINLNTGEHLWMTANADTPDWVKNNPALKGIDLPRTGLPDRVGLLVTKSLLFAGEGAGLYGSDGGGGRMFRAHDKATGAIVAEIELPANQAGIPMTYSINGKQYIVVAVGAVGHPGELIALSL